MKKKSARVYACSVIISGRPATLEVWANTKDKAAAIVERLGYQIVPASNG